MSAQNGQSAQVVPIVVALPSGAHAPQFQVAAQWHTGTGILCPPKVVQHRPLTPAMVLEFFVQLVNQGLVHQVIREEGKAPVVGPLPTMELTLGRLAKGEEIPPSPSATDLEKKWGEGVS